MSDADVVAKGHDGGYNPVIPPPPATSIESLDAVYDWFDAFYQAGVPDALERYKRLRAQGPVVLSRGMDFGEVTIPNLWNWGDRPSAMTLTYDTTVEVLRSPERFGHQIYASELGEQNPMFRDGPGHIQFRKMVLEAFNPKAVQFWKETTNRVANELIDSFAGDGRADLVTQFARILPARVFGAFIDVPDRDIERLSAIAVRQFHPFDAQGMEAVKMLSPYFAALIADRRALSPEELATRSDLVSLLVRVSLDGRKFTDTEINTTLHVLLIGGVDTVFKTLAGNIYFLMTEQGLLEQLRSDRKLIVPAVEEGIRLASPNTFGAARLALEDTKVGGVPIEKGTAVICNISMSNRDPARWDNPDQYDLNREQKGHAGWGTGPHICLGMHLGRQVLYAGINALLDRCENLRPDPDQSPAALSGVGSMSPTTLPVRFDAP